MQYNPNSRLDPSQMGSRGGGGRGGTIAVGGGASILVIILALLFGIDPSVILGGGGAGPAAPGETGNQYAHCQQGSDIAEDPECRFVAFTNSIQTYWTEALPGYQQTETQTFSGGIQTACGNATAEVGPFYCPADTTVYFDPSFFDGALKQLGAQGGDAAEAYVVAHEYGHHIQNLTGVMERVQSAGQEAGPTSPQVRLELQADCYAGVWFRHAEAQPNGPIADVTQEDLNLAVDAALTVGDDNIQEQTQGRVTPHNWTHGSSEQRKQWLLRGFETGDPNQCNTFSADALG